MKTKIQKKKKRKLTLHDSRNNDQLHHVEITSTGAQQQALGIQETGSDNKEAKVCVKV